MALDVLDIDFSGTTDASGNLSVTRIPSPAYWCVLKVVAQTAGAPEWAVQVNQRSVTFGRGRRVDLGPVPIQPKDEVQVVVTGAEPNVGVTGKLLGVTGQLQEVIGSYAPSPNTIAMDTVPLVLLTDRIDTAAGSGSKSYPMPPGAQTVMVTIDLANASRNIIPTQLIAKCFPSDFAPIQAGAAVLNVNPRQLGLLNPIDTTFDVEWTMAGANAANCFLDVTVLAANLLNPQNVAFQFDANQNLDVSMASAQPATWQAANTVTQFSIDMSVLGIHHIISAPGAGHFLRLFHIFAIPSASGAFAGNWQDTAGTLVSSDTLQQTGARPMQFGGWRMGGNVGLDFNVTAVGASFLVGHVASSFE